MSLRGSWNMEGPRKKCSTTEAVFWILGLKTEKGGDSVNTAGVIDTEDFRKHRSPRGSYLPGFGSFPVNQAAFVVNDSKRPSFTQVSVHNHPLTDPSVPDGDFKVQVKEGRAGVVRDLDSSTIAAQTPPRTGGSHGAALHY